MNIKCLINEEKGIKIN